MSKPYGLMTPEREEWADDHGYVRYRCPHGHGTFYSDSGPQGNCPSCGPDPDEYCDHCGSLIEGKVVWVNDIPFCEGCRTTE